MADDVAQDVSVAPPPAEPCIYRAVRSGERLYQGEVVEKVQEWVPSYAAEAPDTVSIVSPMRYEFAVVLTQDCDLEQDWTRRAADLHIETDLHCMLLCHAVIADSALQERFQRQGLAEAYPKQQE